MLTRYIHYHQPQLRRTVDFTTKLDKAFQTVRLSSCHVSDHSDQDLEWQ